MVSVPGLPRAADPVAGFRVRKFPARASALQVRGASPSFPIVTVSVCEVPAPCWARNCTPAGLTVRIGPLDETTKVTGMSTDPAADVKRTRPTYVPVCRPSGLADKMTRAGVLPDVGLT